MANLQTYRAKRDFKKTAEPKGNGRARAKSGALSFVVQEHRASRLHYDFRLEIDGVLKSWAVPKGPPLKPTERRLAVETENHPLEYVQFEGKIPKGNYGAGTVKIWDAGVFEPEGDPIAAYRAGKITFFLQGTRLRGRYALVRSDRLGKKSWLLLKSNQLSSKTSTPAPAKKKGSPHSALPEFIAPQLAVLAEAPPTGEGWIYEVKWDGYRICARIESGEVRLFTRQKKDWSERFRTITRDLKKLNDRSAWLDGEVVHLNADGTSDFQKLQNAMGAGADTDRLAYLVFDLLHLDGEDLRELPLIERKRRLRELLSSTKLEHTMMSEHSETAGTELIAASCKRGLEGLIAKSGGKPYREERSPDWLKLKCSRRQEFVIGGYTAPKGSRARFGSLLLGYHREDGALEYAGHVGTGFTKAGLTEIEQMLKAHKRKSAPFREAPKPNTKPVWVDAKVVCEVKFSEWTADGRLRHPVFMGLREDKPAADVRREAVKSAPTRRVQAPRSRELKRLSHPDKVLFPKMGLTKEEIARFYLEVADEMMPHLSGRPLMVLRCPDGEGTECFFQKRPFKPMDGLVTLRPPKNLTKQALAFAVESPSGLVSLVQMGCLELHAWQCRAKNLNEPDQIVFDLDPDVSVPFARVRKTAWQLRDALRELKLKSFVKLSGGKGLHLHVPLRPGHTWDEALAFSRRLAEEMARRDSKGVLAQMSKEKRSGKIFIDYLRNDAGSTAVAPYSLRAKPEAPVALPLDWDELEDDLSITPRSYGITETLAYLDKKGKGAWADFFKSAGKLPVID